ncbi:MAG: ATP-binding protein [Planctomycetota bacterium]
MEPRVEDYEKLGAFYLGRTWDRRAGAVGEELLLYDSKDLTTHAVCVGMTGSGKTGLCISLLEEAAIDGIPALVVDLKGDLVNLLLTFPSLSAADFRPWVDAGEATRKGMDLDAYAADRAKLWKKGLADWGQDGARIERLRAAADFAVYTPGSDAGRSLTILKSFAAPSAALRDDADAFRDRVQGTVSGLLALLGLEPDPVRSREHILLSNILDAHWREGRSLDLAGLIRAVQSPPFDRVGVFELDSFFPAGDRLALAMSLNNLLASPGFSSWLEGESLDVGRLLWTETGRPRVSILSIAHLSEAERMFFMTILLNEVVAWTRTQPGTSTLRALLYIDEVFGYLPPTANPPSKKPLLTLLKQARAFGIGCVLATQNPVDLDYKALSNAGTWFLGRLQTERDKMRVLDGLEGAAGGAHFDRSEMEKILSGLGQRVFVMNNAHEDGPVVFHTRWAMSYLAGPMTRTQIRALGERNPAPSAEPKAPAPLVAAPAAARAAAVPAPEADRPPERPVAPSGIEEGFLPLGPGAPRRGRVVYRPALAARASVHFANATAGVDEWRDLELVAPLEEDVPTDPWEAATRLEAGALDTDSEPLADAAFDALPREAGRAASFSTWEKKLEARLYRDEAITTFSCRSPKARSEPGETEGDFRARLRALADERRDLEVEKLRRKYASKLDVMQRRLRSAEERVAREEAQYGQSKTSTVVSIGKTILGALFGRKLTSAGSIGGAATAVSRAGRASKERDDVKRAEEELEIVKRELGELEALAANDVAELEGRLAAEELDIDAKPVRIRKSDTAISRVRLVWMPWVLDENGRAEPGFRLD